jgi:hypothetical protein
MKTKHSILIFTFMVTFLFISVGNWHGYTYPQESKEPYFSQVITTPDKALNFNIFIFHHKYRWVESTKEGNFSTVSMVIQNKNKTKPLKWEDYKIYFLLKDGTLFHNYTTVAESGNYACKYRVEPDKQYVQLICFAKKFTPNQVERVWIKMTHFNFIRLLYNSKTYTASEYENR